MEHRDCIVEKGCGNRVLQPEITGRGNDAEVRKKRDGTFAVYEIKRNMVSVK